jgi:MoaD family protein
MKIRVEFFSRLREATGTSEIVRELKDGSTVQDLLDDLYKAFPCLRKWDSHIRVAADVEYVGRNDPLKEGKTISVMPPVQGG